MRPKLRRCLFLIVPVLLAGLSAGAAGSQAPGLAEEVELSRPIPGPVVPPQLYQDAVEAGTRTEDGSPGPEYWQPWSSYEIEASLDPAAASVRGRETIVFHNDTPDEIPYLMLHLHQNVYAEGVVRARPAQITGGMVLHRVRAAGVELFEIDREEEPGYRVSGSLMRLQPPAPVAAGGELELEIAWSFEVPESGSGRMGHSDREIFFIGYWFPKIGVYDDLRGWDAEPYLGGAEFYDSFDEYRVSITVPVDWTVLATGDLQNPAEVFSEQTRERLAGIDPAGDVVRVADLEDRAEGRVTAEPPGGALTYRYHTPRIRDFTWTASDTQVWDATAAAVPDRDGDGAEDMVMIHSFWRPDRAPLWEEQARYAKHSIEFLSEETGLTYPWPHMTSVEGSGIIGGGMEFPMLTVIGPYRERKAADLYGVTVHEIAHMWTPLIVGSNEKRHAWMDEGFASYLGNRGEMDYFPEEPDPEQEDRESYLNTARAQAEGSMMLHGDYYEVGYGTASYSKPATLLVTLRNLLGEEVFYDAIRTYFREWAHRKPAPWDFFSTLERFAGVDLDWFWDAYYYETWVLDRSVESVDEAANEGTTILIQDRGFVPMPVPVRIETRDEGVLERTIPVSHWLSDATRYEIEIPASAGEVLEVQIDPEGLFPDIDRDDDVWPRRQQDGDDTSRP